MSFFGAAKKNNIVAVIDISSSSVGGTVFKRDKDKQIKILGIVRKPANFLLDVSFEASWRCSLDALRQVIKKMMEIYPAGPGKTLCVFSSPWFVSQTKIVNIAKEKSFEVTGDFFNKLIENEEKKFKEEQKDNAELIEHEAIKTELNGYFVKSPAGKKTKTVKSWIYVSLGIARAMKDVRKEVLKNLGAAPLEFKTFPLVAFRVLNDIIKSKEDFGVIDISGEVTDILLLKSNFLEEVITFPKGINLLYRNLAAELNTFMKETPSILRAYSGGHRTLESSEKISSAIGKSQDEWHSFFEKAVESSSKKNLLPQNMYFMGDEIASKYFAQCVAKNDFSKLTVLGKPFNLKRIDTGPLAHYFETKTADKSGLELEKDINLMFEAFYANYNL